MTPLYFTKCSWARAWSLAHDVLSCWFGAAMRGAERTVLLPRRDLRQSAERLFVARHPVLPVLDVKQAEITVRVPPKAHVVYTCSPPEPAIKVMCCRDFRSEVCDGTVGGGVHPRKVHDNVSELVVGGIESFEKTWPHEPVGVAIQRHWFRSLNVIVSEVRVLKKV